MAQVLKNHNTTWDLSREEPLTPVLAVGSNAAPDQLARKFPEELFPEGVVIPVLRCVLPDFDVVYAPLISSYGSCTGAACFGPLQSLILCAWFRTSVEVVMLHLLTHSCTHRACFTYSSGSQLDLVVCHADILSFTCFAGLQCSHRCIRKPAKSNTAINRLKQR